MSSCEIGEKIFENYSIGDEKVAGRGIGFKIGTMQ